MNTKAPTNHCARSLPVGESSVPEAPAPSSAQGESLCRPSPRLIRCPGTWGREQGGIDARALLDGQAVGLEVGIHDLKVLFAEIVLFQQLAEA